MYSNRFSEICRFSFLLRIIYSLLTNYAMGLITNNCFNLLRVAIILFVLGIEKFLQPFRRTSFGHGKRKLCILKQN